MRRSARIIVSICLCWLWGLLPVHGASRLNPEIHHFVDVWGGVGYMGWLHSMEGTKPFSGVAPSVGVGYRLVYNRFIFQTGVEGQFTWTKGHIADIERQEWMNDWDIPNEPFRMHIRVYDCTDVNKTVNLQVPIMMGYEYGRFYGLAGVTVGMSLYGNATSSAAMQTTGEYDAYIGIMEEIPNHGFETKELTSGDCSFRMGPYLMAHMEAGARLDKFKRYKGFNVKNHTYRVYLGVYAEYSVLNAHNSTSNGSMVGLDLNHGVQAKLTPFMLCDEMKSGKVNPLTVGIKCTMLFELPQAGKSYIYDWNKVEKGYIKRGGNQSIQ